MLRLFENSWQLVNGGPVLRRFEGEIDLNQHFGCPPCFCRASIDPSQQIDAVDRMDDGARFRRLLRLVGLQVTDQVPANVGIGGALAFLYRVLHTILAKVPLAGFIGAADIIHGERLGNGNETDIGWRTARAGSGFPDARADLCEA